MARETAANHCDANSGELRHSTERRKATLEFFIALACVFATARYLIHPARTLYRRDTRPRTPASDDLPAGSDRYSSLSPRLRLSSEGFARAVQRPPQPASPQGRAATRRAESRVLLAVPRSARRPSRILEGA